MHYHYWYLQYRTSNTLIDKIFYQSNSLSTPIPYDIKKGLVLFPKLPNSISFVFWFPSITMREFSTGPFYRAPPVAPSAWKSLLCFLQKSLGFIFYLVLEWYIAVQSLVKTLPRHIYFSFSVLRWHVIVQTDWNNYMPPKLFFNSKHSYCNCQSKENIMN